MFFTAWMAFFCIPFLVNAQSPIDKIFDKYAGQDNFTTVNISKDMFEMFMQMDKEPGRDSGRVQMKKMMEQLNGLKVLTFKFDSTKIARGVAVYNEFAGVFPAASYKEIMTINEGRQSIRFLTRQESSGKISELVMLMKDKSEVAALSLTGNIDLSTVSRLSRGMNLPGMKGLHRLDRPNRK